MEMLKAIENYQKCKSRKKKFTSILKPLKKQSCKKQIKQLALQTLLFPLNSNQKTLPNKQKFFENLYPALEAVLAKFISFLQITTADFSQKKNNNFL